MRWLVPQWEDALLDYVCKLTPPTRCQNVSKSEHFGKTSSTKIYQCSATGVDALAIGKATALNQPRKWETRACKEWTVATQGFMSLYRTRPHGKLFRPDGLVHVATNLNLLNVASPSYVMTLHRTPTLIATLQITSRCCKIIQLSLWESLVSTR